jgi:hypothetical protein
MDPVQAEPPDGVAVSAPADEVPAVAGVGEQLRLDSPPGASVVPVAVVEHEHPSMLQASSRSPAAVADPPYASNSRRPVRPIERMMA